MPTIYNRSKRTKATTTNVKLLPIRISRCKMCYYYCHPVCNGPVAVWARNISGSSLEQLLPRWLKTKWIILLNTILISGKKNPNYLGKKCPRILEFLVTPLCSSSLRCLETGLYKSDFSSAFRVHMLPCNFPSVTNQWIHRPLITRHEQP